MLPRLGVPPLPTQRPKDLFVEFVASGFRGLGLRVRV